MTRKANFITRDQKKKKKVHGRKFDRVIGATARHQPDVGQLPVIQFTVESISGDG